MDHEGKLTMKGTPAYNSAVFLLRVIIIHTLTYFIMGLIISNLFNYHEILEAPVIRDFMIGYGSASVFWGPFAQPIRGLIIGLVLMPFRTFLGGLKHGWLYLWLIFVGIGILSTPAAAPSSIEGLIYTRLPLWYHLIGLPEILIQTLVFSWLVHQYMRHPSGILASLPEVFGTLLQAFAGACFAFIGYAVVSILYALAGSADINSAENMSFRVQGLFIALLICNFLIIIFHRANHRLSQAKLIALFGVVWISNALVIGIYQQLFWVQANLGYAILAPVIPSLIMVAIMSKKGQSNNIEPIRR
jgi:cytochrome c oxidase subunit IV